MDLTEYFMEIPTGIADNIVALSNQEQGLIRSNVGGWQYAFHNNPPEWFKPLYNQILARFRDYTLTSGWFNINGPEHWVRWHRHPSNEYVAILYVQAPENSGNLEIRVDRTSYTIQPKIGKLIVFPGNYLHQVCKNKSQENRISLAFNLIKR